MDPRGLRRPQGPAHAGNRELPHAALDRGRVARRLPGPDRRRRAWLSDGRDGHLSVRAHRSPAIGASGFDYRLTTRLTSIGPPPQPQESPMPRRTAVTPAVLLVPVLLLLVGLIAAPAQARNRWRQVPTWNIAHQGGEDE